MSDKQYDSVLVGYADDARHNDEGELLSLIHISEPTRPY